MEFRFFWVIFEPVVLIGFPLFSLQILPLGDLFPSSLPKSTKSRSSLSYSSSDDPPVSCGTLFVLFVFYLSYLPILFGFPFFLEARTSLLSFKSCSCTVRYSFLLSSP